MYTKSYICNTDNDPELKMKQLLQMSKEKNKLNNSSNNIPIKNGMSDDS